MRLLPLLVAVAVCRASYTSGRSRRESSWDRPLAQILPPITHSANRFAFLSYKLYAGNTTENLALASSDLFLSYWAMSLGSVKRTRTVFDDVFPPPHLTEADREPGLRYISDQIRQLRDLDYNITSEAFHDWKFQPTVEYVNGIRRVLLMEVYGVEFDKKNQTAETLDPWFSSPETDGVSTMVKPSDFVGNVSLALIDHVSFRGSWARPFAAIGDQTFHLTESKNVSIPFIQQSDVYAHGDLPALDAKFIEIPYKNRVANMGMSMYVILPNEVDGFPYLEKNIQKIGLAQLSNGQRTAMTLKMPNFGIGSRIVVSVDYQQTVASRETVNKIIHCVTLGVEEPSPTNASEQPGSPRFVADRPFIAIVATTGENPLVLFMARYLGPEGLAYNYYSS